ncbi:hypothetical protein CON33_21100 [Bacillus anthracis]|nr:hypothetical protein CON33_21100 [Bacillus anthracis]
MSNIFNFLNHGWVGSVIGIIGILIAILTFVLSKTKKRLVYQSKSLKIIGKDNTIIPNEIEITYKGKQVPRVIKTRLIIWNSGKETVNGIDIVTDDNLKLAIDENEEIISIDILQRTRTVNKFDAFVDKTSKNKAILTFDYLDPNDGIVLEILHTDLKWYPRIKGTIKGLPKGFLNWNNGTSGIAYNNETKMNFLSFLDPNSKSSKVFSIASMILGIGFITCAIFAKDIEEFFKKFPAIDNAGRIAFFILGILYILVPIFDLIKFRKKPPKELDIDYVDKHEEYKEENSKAV